MSSIDKVLYIFLSDATPFPDNYAGIPNSMAALGIEMEAVDLRTLTFEGYVAAINRFKPDLIFCFIRSPLQKIATYVAEYHPVPVLHWFTEDPNFTVLENSLIHSSVFDFWFTIDNNMVPYYKTKAYFMPPAFDQDVYNNLGLQRDWELSYIGQLGHKLSWCMLAPYMEVIARHHCLLCLEKRLSLKGLISLFRLKPLSIGAWPTLLRLEIFRRQRDWHRPRDEYEKNEVINRSMIHVGLSRVRGYWETALRKLLPDYPVDENGLFYQPKGRTFEAVGGGAMLLNDYYPELEQLFVLGKEAVAFRFGDREEFADKLQWYIKHDSERERIARAGWERGRRQHTLACRVQQILDIARTG